MESRRTFALLALTLAGSILGAARAFAGAPAPGGAHAPSGAHAPGGAPASVQPVCTESFPMDVVHDGGERDGLDVRPNGDALSSLSAVSDVLMVGVPLPGGARVDLELTRVPLATRNAEVLVDGSPAPAIVDAGASAWRGRVVGDEQSDVFLSFSRFGSRGWIRANGEYVHLLAGPGAAGDWAQSVSKLIGEGSLNARGSQLDFVCPVDANGRSSPGGDHTSFTTGTILECRMAIETDYQLYQKFNDLTAEQTYLNQLLAAASARYDQQLQVVLTVAYLGLHTNANDGWVSGDNGAGSGAMLDEFRTAWTNNIPNGANLAHFLSGAALGGGVAYLDTLCNGSYGFAVSGDLSGNMPFPVMQGPLTWDFMVFTHETGHNFGTPHTHDFCPPIDQCPPQGYWGQCQTAQVCISTGTIMSYCHLCSGGMNNMTLFFHPQCSALMRQHAESSCLHALCALPTNYCALSPNTFDPFGAQMSYAGSQEIGHNDLTLIATGVPPGVSSLFYYGHNQASQPFGNGVRCVASPVFRLPVLQSNVFGEVDYSLNYGALPAGGQIHAGETWKFQLWFRNPGAGGPGFNLSDGLSIQFCP